jgi:alkylated DNA repair dioxygenase AlkB
MCRSAALERPLPHDGLANARLFAHLAPVLSLPHTRAVRLSAGAFYELHEGFITAQETRGLFAMLCSEVPFLQRPIIVFGREVMQPRLSAWIGQPEAVYRYSNVEHRPLPFGPTLAALRARIAAFVDVPFNSVLCNLYRDGADAMGMHSDGEPELGPDPVIASLSLGAERTFVLRAKQPKDALAHKLTLADGSLLVMRGTTQREYKHGIPRVRGLTEPRMNLTFRRIFARA